MMEVHQVIFIHKINNSRLANYEFNSVRKSDIENEN